MINTRKVNARIYELGLTQEQIAKEVLDMSYPTLNAKLNNKRRIYADEVAKLCKVLKIDTKEELKEFFGLDFLIVPKSLKNETREE